MKWAPVILAGVGLGALAMLAGGDTARRPTRIVAIGDSITAAQDGYVHAIGRALGVPVHALGYPGRGAEFIKGQIGEALKVRPSHVLILAGVNDLAGGRNVFLSAVEVMNMAAIVRQVGVVPVVIGVTPWASYQDGQRYDAARQAEFNQALRSIAPSQGAAFVDTSAMGDPQGRLPAMYGADGLHLNGQGHARLAQLVMERMGWAA